jgi:hypothetical protein
VVIDPPQFYRFAGESKNEGRAEGVFPKNWGKTGVKIESGKKRKNQQALKILQTL